MTLARGWKQRRADADHRRADRAAAWEDDRADVRRQRAALAEKARVEAERVAREISDAMLRNRTTCPCCGEGSLSVAHVELILRAIAQMPEGSRPDARVIAELHGVAGGTYDGAGIELPNRGSLRLHRPRPVATEAAIETITETPAEPVKATKAVRKPMAVPPFLGGD